MPENVGNVIDVAVLESDSSLLSDGVDSMIKNAAPFPAFTSKMSQSPVTLQVPIRFTLVSE